MESRLYSILNRLKINRKRLQSENTSKSEDVHTHEAENDQEAKPLPASLFSDPISSSPLRMNCSICYEEAILSHTLELESCRHVLCRDCIKHHCKARYSEGEDCSAIPCPFAGCFGFLSQSDLRLALGDIDFHVLDRRALEKAVEIDPTLYLCPSPDCEYIISWWCVSFQSP